MMKPCLDCGAPAPGTRCQPCSVSFDRGRDTRAATVRKARGGRPQYGGGYARAAAAVRASATVCWLCGEGPRPNDPWQADHVVPAAAGGGAGPLLAAHRSCNVARSNAFRGAGGAAVSLSSPAAPRISGPTPTPTPTPADALALAATGPARELPYPALNVEQGAFGDPGSARRPAGTGSVIVSEVRV